MSGSASKSPATLVSALERLASAVGRLEQAVEAAGDGPDAKLGGDLETALAERARLRETHAAVAEQLDATIARLRGVLDG